jgi:hypothetical protein
MLLGGAAAILVAGVIWVSLSHEESPVSPDSYSQIRLGMTQEEVETILGVPHNESYSLDSGAGIHRVTVWVGPTLAIIIAWDSEDRVLNKQCAEVVPPSWWANIRRWTGVDSLLGMSNSGAVR